MYRDFLDLNHVGREQEVRRLADFLEGRGARVAPDGLRTLHFVPSIRTVSEAN
jgi:hypothetical protein